MKLIPVTDPAFREYGQVLEGYDFTAFIEALKKTNCPTDSVTYVASEPTLEAVSPLYEQLRDHYYGGMPIQIGYCNGFNTMMNGLEYHRDSEVNIAVGDTIFFLAKQSEIDPKDYSLDSSVVKAFLLPAGMGVEMYATTLHLAPASTGEGKTFQVAVVLPKGTNVGKPEFEPMNGEDKILGATNKWIISHEGAPFGSKTIKGVNHDARDLW